MSNEEYYLVLESIFYGLILAKILNGWSKMIRSYGEFTLYWIHLVWTLAIFLTVIQSYSSELSLDGKLEYSGIMKGVDIFYHIVLGPSLLYIASNQSFPNKIEGTDFKEYSLDVRRKFMIPIVLFIAYQMIQNLSKGLGLIFVLPHLIGVVVGILTVVFRSRILVVVAVILYFLGVAYFLIIS